jgi:hypothetical protein
MIFADMNALRQKFPSSAELIEWENRAQYPQAKFITAGTLSMSLEEHWKDLCAFFDVGSPGMMLWVWVAGLSELHEEDDVYIDEYYEIPVAEAQKYIAQFEK